MVHCALGHEKGAVCLCAELPHNEGGRYITDKNCFEQAPLEMLDEFHLDNVSFIKIDTENFELQVLEGARETILRNKPVLIVEVLGNRPKASEENVDLNFAKMTILRYIESLGYEVRHICIDDYLALPLE